MINKSAILTAAVSMLAAAGAADAQSSITLFGQAYRVQRFDYSQQVQWPSVRYPGETLQLVEVEGACYAGNNRIIASSEAMSEVFPGELKNHVIEFQLQESGGVVTGLSFVRTLVVNDFQVNGYELSPSGVTINTGITGIGAGGNLVVGSSEDNLRAFSLAGATLGQPLPAQPGQSCSPDATACALSLVNMLSDVEDVTYVPGFGARAGAIYVLNQEFPDRVLRLNANGTLDVAGSFVVGGDIASPPIGNPTPKGLSYLADSSAFPSAIRRPGGTLIVGLDDDGPGLQVFDLSGNLIAYESLTVDGTPTGASRLELPLCSDQLAIESLASDPVTGRLFLFNQGGGLTCNELFVLTPASAACASDIAGAGPDNASPDGIVDGADFITFINSFSVGDAQVDDAADLNADNIIDGDDFIAFINAFSAGC